VQLERRKASASGKFARLALDLPFGRLTGIAAGPQDGPPVLAVHGWNSQAEFFQPLLSAVIRQGLRVYAFDMPAHGQTRDVNPDKATSTLVEWVETLIAATGALDVPAWRGMIAHSFGGLAASFAMGPRPWGGLPPLKAASLALIAGASGMETVIRSYAAADGTSDAGVADIVRGVEAATDSPLAGLSIRSVVSALPPRLFVVHDPADEVARLSDLREELAQHPLVGELLRAGAGHDGILFQLDVGRAVAKFVAA
jgi:pimeloyl-ACP methyl ester carboxylesterase